MRRTTLGLLLLALSACEPEAGLVVGKVGDSIMARMGEELEFEAQRRDRGPAMVTVAALPCTALGRDLAYFTRRSVSLRERVHLDAMVVSLGTNDLADLREDIETWPLIDTAEELQAALDGLLSSFPEVPVLWLIPASPASAPERVAHFRAGLEAAALRWPKLMLMEQAPQWFEGGDGTHHSAKGEGQAAQAIVARLLAIQEAVQP